jgi:hypothetical protein
MSLGHAVLSNAMMSLVLSINIYRVSSDTYFLAGQEDIGSHPPWYTGRRTWQTDKLEMD